MSEIKVDTISEQTADNGVAVDGVTLKDSTVLIGGDKVLDEQQSAIADVDSSTVDGTYGAEEQAVIEDLRTKLNAILAALRAHGIIAT